MFIDKIINDIIIIIRSDIFTEFSILEEQFSFELIILIKMIPTIKSTSNIITTWKIA